MLEELLPRVDHRVRSNPIGPTIERYAEHLVARGYSPDTWRQYVRVAQHFGQWLGRRRISRQTVQQFIGQYAPACRGPVPTNHRVSFKRAALRHLLEMIGAGPLRPPFPPGYAGQLLQHYAQYLATVRGLAVASVKQYVAYTQAMLSRLGVHRPSQFRLWTPEQIERYVLREARGRGAVGCVRSFLRFLLQEGLIHRDLAVAVPTFARWRMAPLPPTLTRQQVERLLRAADRRTPMGLRDRAILLSLSELGLRASDVAGLQLDGVDLPGRVLRLRRCKEREATVLPIPSRLAAALDAYLRHGRPVCSSPAVFVRHCAPLGKPLLPIGICDVVLHRAQLAGLRDRIGGTHVLRHSLASRMLGAGATRKQIADLLGHQCIDTTSLYAKVDLKTLAKVALPWPGAKEVRQ